MFPTISDEERSSCGVSGLPDTPQLTTKELQEKFDSLGNLALDKLVAIIEILNSENAANYIHYKNGNTLQDEFYSKNTDIENLQKAVKNIPSIDGESNYYNITIQDAEWTDITETVGSFTQACEGNTFFTFTVTEQSSFGTTDQIGIRMLDLNGNVVACNIVTAGEIGDTQGSLSCTLSCNVYSQEEDNNTLEVYLTNPANIKILCNRTVIA